MSDTAPKPGPFDTGNVRFLGTLTAEQLEWWQSFGRHLQRAQDDFNRLQPLRNYEDAAR